MYVLLDSVFEPIAKWQQCPIHDMNRFRTFFNSLLVASMLLLLPGSADGQLSNIPWKAAEELKRDHGNKVTFNDEGFVTELVIKDFPSGFILGQLEIFKHLESVTVDSHYYFEDSNMGGIRKLGNLKKFAIRNSRYSTAASLELLSEAPALESLELYECGQITSLYALARIRKLTHLSIIPEDTLSFASLVECKNLKSIKLGGSSSIDDSALKSLARVASLESVDLTNTSVTDEGLAELGKLPKLQKLILKDCDSITGEAFADFQFPETLKVLNLEKATKVNDDGLAELKRFSNLEELRLFENDKIEGRGFECVGSMKKLKTLSCPKTSISDKHLKPLDGISTLELIWFPDCGGISGRGLDYLSKSKGCKRMSLNQCRKIDSPDFEVLAKFESLEALYLANTRIRNENIDLLCGLKKLKTLNLDGNYWLDDSAIEKLEDCSVSKLVLLGLPRLTNAALRSASKMKNLENLYVTAHKKLDGSGFDSFAGNERLKFMTIQSPGQLSLDAFSKIGQLPNMEKLYLNEGKISIAQLEQLSGMQKLKKLNYKIADSESVNERLISILKTFPNLE